MYALHKRKSSLVQSLSGPAELVAGKLKAAKDAYVLAFELSPEQRRLESSLLKAIDLIMQNVATRSLDLQKEKLGRLCEFLLEDVAPPRTSIAELGMRANVIRRLVEEGEWLTAADIAKHGSYSSSNPSEPANRWKKEGKIFAVTFKGQDFFAVYQFDDQLKPRPVIREVLKILKEKRDTWKIAAWFASVNGRLGGKRPQDCLDAPDRVIDAARHELAGFDG